MVLKQRVGQFPILSSMTLSESTMPGSSFVIPTAIDPDGENYGKVHYELLPAMEKFELRMQNQVDGSVEPQLVLTGRLDREADTHCDMKVIAYDGGQPPKTGSIDVRVEVQDVNDNGPVFTSDTYEATVPEDLPIQSIILQVTAHDLDAGVDSAVSYELSEPTEAALGHLFALSSETGGISLQNSLDYEEATEYHLIVLARDEGPGSIPAEAEVIIKVLDVNDNSPQITVTMLDASGDAKITENAGPGTFVAHMSVFDADSGKNAEVSCSLTGDHFALEEIYSGDYKIINLTPLDREIREKYNIQVTCKDNGDVPQFAMETLQVTVIDVNDNPPVFSQTIYIATVVENNLVGAFLLDVNATDSDTGANAEIRYFLDDQVTHLFDIDEKSGTIMGKVTLDYEETQHISFTVTAVDRGDPSLATSARVLIVVEDANDNLPTFSHESYAFSVAENQPYGNLVGVVNDIDRDSNPYNKFEFSLVPSASAEFFTIQPNTGEITTSMVLDREETPMYSLIIEAVDLADPQMSSTTTVSIYVMDTNDNAPVFVNPSSDNDTIYVSNLADIGYEVTRVSSIDKDMGINAAVTYGFYQGDRGGLFNIDSSTGSVSVAKSLRHIDDQLYQLVVIARDQGVPQMSAMANLNIVIKESVPNN